MALWQAQAANAVTQAQTCPFGPFLPKKGPISSLWRGGNKKSSDFVDSVDSGTIICRKKGNFLPFPPRGEKRACLLRLARSRTYGHVGGGSSHAKYNSLPADGSEGLGGVKVVGDDCTQYC